MNNENIITVIVCSYKANKEFELCLSQMGRFGLTNYIIYENSPSDYTLNREMLNKYNIPYTNNPGGTHAETMNKMLKEVKTKYALILDADCFIINDIMPYVRFCLDNRIRLYGDICGSRGGYNLYKRVHPWFCIVDADFVNSMNIPFTDYERVKSTGSDMFYTSKPYMQIDRKKWYYDVGSTMFEDVIKGYGVCADIGVNKPYIHKEGSSWYGDSEIEGFRNINEIKKKQLDELYNELTKIGKYLDKLSK